MKAVILAGGLGTRLSEETDVKPKPMVEIGDKPILWHIMKIYSHYGINDFIICCGYKGYIIKEYFANYYLHNSDVTFDMMGNGMKIHQNKAEPWKVTLIDTGQNAGTGGRLKRIREYIGKDDFCFTYGDGLSDVDINRLIAHHKNNDKLVTVTAVIPPSRYGVLISKDGIVRTFEEKPEGSEGWINGGFFVVSPKAIDYIDEDTTMWEQKPMRRLVKEGQLTAFHHKGFWFPMDTLRDKNRLDELWSSNEAPWKIWV